MKVGDSRANETVYNGTGERFWTVIQVPSALPLGLKNQHTRQLEGNNAYSNCR